MRDYFQKNGRFFFKRDFSKWEIFYEMGDFFQNGKHLRHVRFLEIFFKMGDFLHFRNKCRIRKNTITYKRAFQLSQLKKSSE